MKDWKGNSKSTFACLAASSHSNNGREQHDYYATSPQAAEWLLDIIPLSTDTPIWECASGEDHLAKVFRQHGFTVRTSDIIQRTPTTEQLNFLTCQDKWDGHH